MTTSQAAAFTSGVGRIVWGDPSKLQDVTDPITRQKKMKPDGTVQQEYACGVAFPKADPETARLLQILGAERQRAYPQLMGPDTWPLPGVKFSTKIIDGDGRDAKAQAYGTREGYAGCWVVTFKSQYAPGLYEYQGIGWVATTKIKTGDYVKINGTTAPNNQSANPGMYVNLGMVAFDHGGAAIVSGPSAADAFGTPGGPAAAGGAAAHPQPPASPPTPATPAAPASAAGSAAPAAPTAPSYSGYMPPGTPAPGQPAAPPPAGPTLTPAGVAAGGSYDAFRTAGWTDEQLRGAGYLA